MQLQVQQFVAMVCDQIQASFYAPTPHLYSPYQLWGLGTNGVWILLAH